MVAGVYLIAPFEGEKHLLVMLARVFCDKTYLLICREAKARTSAPGVLCSQNGGIK